MKLTTLALAPIVALTLVACGGGGTGSGTASVTGFTPVVKVAPVATVTAKGAITASTSRGSVRGTASAKATFNQDATNINGRTGVNVELSGSARASGRVQGHNVSANINFGNDRASGSLNISGPSINESQSLSGAYDTSITVSARDVAQYNSVSDGISAYAGSIDTTIQGVRIQASLTGTDNARTDLDVVKDGYNSFFITNEGTGTKAMADVDYSGLTNAAFAADVISAHKAGWTGTGVTITTTHADNVDSLAYIIAPNANPFQWVKADVNYAQIAKGDDKISFGASKDVDLTVSGTSYNNMDNLVAAGSALVWNKFDTLSGDQVATLVNQTANGNQFDLGAALSPVGNLR